MDKGKELEAQREAANILLDLGVSIPMTAPRLFRLFGLKRIRLTIRRPYWGTMVRISRAWLSLGITAETVKSNSLEDDMKLMSEHGKTVSKIVAYGILRGQFSGLFAGMLGRILLWRVHPVIMVEAAFKMATLSRVEDFTNTIRLLATMDVTRIMSPDVKGS
jgi:hypothetical protein